MTTFLDGVAVRFYRGIGADAQLIAPFSRMNFFIGPNNAGKSIVLNLLSHRLSKSEPNKAQRSLSPTETYRGQTTGTFQLGIGAKKESVLEKIMDRAKQKNFNNKKIGIIRDDFISIIDKIQTSGQVWINITDTKNKIVKDNFSDIDHNEAQYWSDRWQLLWGVVQNKNSGGSLQHWIPETLQIIANHIDRNFPEIHLIPAKRQLGETGENFEDLSGRGLIDHLATLQNPAFDKQEDRQRFHRINEFVREITGKPEALLEVPSGREHLLVHLDNKVLPLSSLGTGIHEVVLIAAFCTIHDNTIMCIEEPEIHLHPLLQKKLVNYLVRETGSQYFIATHSSAFIDTPNSTVFRVSNDGSQTYIKPVVTNNEQREILDDLGCQASDILQSNAVIWVEGPSDRIYLKHWLAATDPRLIEGVHYTIMFYGGGLIRHLAASDEALDEFIRLRDLNRNMAIIIDSDRADASDDLKPHAKRIAEEISSGDGVAWITEGREVENYLDGATLQAALKTLHPRIYKKPGKVGCYDHAFYFYRDDPKNPERHKLYKDGDKVGAANLICQEEARLDILDLRDRVAEIADMIGKANFANIGGNQAAQSVPNIP